MTVQLGGHAFGRASLADLHDTFVPDALAGLRVGAFVRCRVLEPVEAAGPSAESKPESAAQAAGSKKNSVGSGSGDAGAALGGGGGALRVSLRASRGGECEGQDPSPNGDPAPEQLDLGALRINQSVSLAAFFCVCSW